MPNTAPLNCLHPNIYLTYTFIQKWAEAFIQFIHIYQTRAAKNGLLFETHTFIQKSTLENFYPRHKLLSQMDKCFYPRHLSFHPLSGSIRCPGVTLDLACHLDGRLQQRRFYTQIFVCDIFLKYYFDIIDIFY